MSHRQSKGVHIECETEEATPTRGGKSSTGCENSLVRKCSRPKAYSYETKRGLKDCPHEAAFPVGPYHFFPFTSPALSFPHIFVSIIKMAFPDQPL